MIRLACAFVLAMAGTAFSQTSRTPPQELIDAWRAKHPAGAATAAIITANGVKQFFSGEVSDTNTNPPDADTLFEIGSVTKGFTGLLAADQMLAGKINATNTLAELLTGWPRRKEAAAGAITLEALATHRSGLPRLPGNMDAAWLPGHSRNPYADYDAKLLYAWLDVARPGETNFEYSNAGFGILGHTLATTAGRPYGELLRERILVPLGLTNTMILLSAAQRARLAQGHRGSQPTPPWDFDVLAGCGALRSSLRDTTRFVEQMSGVRENPLPEVSTLATRQHAVCGPGQNIGLGWMRIPSNRGDLVWHTGGTGGSSSCLVWREGQKLGVVVLAGSDDHDGITKLAFDLMRGL